MSRWWPTFTAQSRGRSRPADTAPRLARGGRPVRHFARKRKQRQLPANEEVGYLVEPHGAARPVPVPHTVVEAEDGACEQASVGLRDVALLHPAHEERGPGELEVARARAGQGAGLL